jgi:hypothetical protein
MRGHTVLSDGHLTHLLQSGDEKLIGHHQHVADKLHIQRLWKRRERDFASTM